MSDQPNMSESMPPAESASDISSDDRLWSALAYVFSPLVSIILLLMEDKKARPFIKYHAFQSLVLGILIWVIMMVLTVVTAGILSCLGFILWLAMLYWAYKAYQGEYVTVPVVTDFIKKQGWA